MTINYLSLLVCIIGLLIYAFTADKKQAIGLHMFWVGLLVFLLQIGPGHALRLP